MVPLGLCGNSKTKVKNRPQKSGTYVYFYRRYKKNKNIEDNIWLLIYLFFKIYQEKDCNFPSFKKHLSVHYDEEFYNYRSRDNVGSSL